MITEELLSQVNEQWNKIELNQKVCDWLVEQKDIPTLLQWIKVELLDGYLEDDEFFQFETFIDELYKNIKELENGS